MSVTTEKAKPAKKKKFIETVGVVSEMIRETPDTHTIRIRMPNLEDEDKPFKFLPGQFVMVRPVVNGKLLPRAYSISSSPVRSLGSNGDGEDGYYDLTVRETDDPQVSLWMNQRKVGDEIVFRGPYGKFVWTEDDPEAEQIFMLGGGSGIAPLKSIYEYLEDKGLTNKIKLLYSSISVKDIILHERLLELERNVPGSKVVFTVTREPENSDWHGGRGRIDPDLIQRELEGYDINKTKAYICGNPSFVETMSNYLQELGFGKDQILHEKWD